MLDRDPEFGGWLWQRNALSRGHSIVVLTDAVIAAEEFRLRWGTLTNADFVRLVYRQCLRREATQAEIDYQLSQFYNRGWTANGFLKSNEFKNANNPRLSAILLYAGLLQRDPTAAERALATSRLTAGTPLATLIAEIVNRPEFTAQFD
jgi:hypothetical protein